MNLTRDHINATKKLTFSIGVIEDIIKRTVSVVCNKMRAINT